MSSTTKLLKMGGKTVRPGQSLDIHLEVSQRYTGDPISLPIRVHRGRRPGPTVFVSAAVHGDELNGTGVIHELMFAPEIKLVNGTLILIPVVNVFGFETQNRYMPDRRDLNRCFPGTPSGNLSSRMAHVIFKQIVGNSDYGIDLHTAAGSRTNFPNVRGDLSVPEVRRVAKAFGCELMVNGKGPTGSLRREATKAGCPTIILEAGEPCKIEPGILEIGMRGVQNVLKEFGMLPGQCVRPAYQTRVSKSLWVRSEVGGLLRFHVSPGHPVKEGEPIATNVSVFGKEQCVLVSPVNGIVLSMTTLPVVKPGEPVCHIAVPNQSLRTVRKALKEVSDTSLGHRLREDLATNISVTEREEDSVESTETDGDF